MTIAWHLAARGLQGAVDLDDPTHPARGRPGHPEPRKRPRSSYIRFEAAQPNETWQSDFTHWRLADGTDVEILNWLDDHSRYLLACTAHGPVTGDDVVTTFLAATDEHGVARLHPDRQRPRLHRPLTAADATRSNTSSPLLGIRQKNGAPATRRPKGRSNASTRP